MDYELCDHSLNLKSEGKKSRRRSPPKSEENQRQRDALTEGKEKPTRESERNSEREVRARPDLSDNLQISHKGKGTSETAGALGNNALRSFSFTSGPK